MKPLLNNSISSTLLGAAQFYHEHSGKEVSTVPPPLTGEEQLYIKWLKESECDRKQIELGSNPREVFRKEIIGQCRLDIGYVQHLHLFLLRDLSYITCNGFDNESSTFSLTMLYFVHFFNDKRYHHVGCCLKDFFFLDANGRIGELLKLLPKPTTDSK